MIHMVVMYTLTIVNPSIFIGQTNLRFKRHSLNQPDQLMINLFINYLDPLLDIAMRLRMVQLY